MNKPIYLGLPIPELRKILTYLIKIFDMVT